MHRLFGLSRDPFAPVCDGDLYWENPPRAAAREAATRALAQGTGVWLCGQGGAGRETLLARAAEDLGLAGRPVLWAGPEGPAGAPGLLDLLLDAAGIEAAAGEEVDAVDRAAALYRALLEGFARGGPVVLALGTVAGAGAQEELAILSRLRVARKPVVALALWGEGEPPVEGLVRVELPSPAEADLRSCLAHRAAACGDPELFSTAELEALVRPCRGLGDAVRRAREALWRRAFSGGPRAGGPAETEGAPATPVLDRSALAEVDQLLEALGPGPEGLQGI